ncbi:MAG TPA: PKD domain-containing protein [Pyrinomonadaceae bacterium]|jgi:PKD repeat protein
MYFFSNVSLFRLLTVLFVAVLTFTGNAFAQKGNSAFGFARGQEAINRLGTRLPAVAARNGKTPAELRRLFLEDPTLHVDEKTDMLLYIDDQVDYTPSALENAPTAEAAPYPYENTFKLHSRPGSNRVIYLDFNGHVTSGTSWNSSYTGGQPINSAPYSLDGDPTTFNQQEQDAIQYIWQRVAEDFAPFDVDVTTEDPGDAAIFRSSSSDALYGTRAVISPTNFTGNSIGGIAYVGVFDYVGTNYKPAFIMTSGLGNNEKNIAEATSHEVGHNLGLSHDGTASVGYYQGHGDWAPIMGVGYYRSVTQWSKGEYPGANQLQDDLAVMQTYGIPVIADDHGNTQASATALSGSSINVAGVVTTRADVDVFQFSTGGGSVAINFNPAPRGANLDIQATIRDANGNTVAVVNPAGLAASYTGSLAAGVYYVTVDGVGAGDLSTGYSDYASIGQYTITGTLTGSNLQAPTAVASANPTSGTAPLNVAFTGSNSTDADGTIVGYSWNFGDGAAVSTLANPTHVYNSAGTFTAVLTVTDDSSLSSTSSVQITVGAAPAVSIYVEGITMSVVRSGKNSSARAVVTVRDSSGAARPGVTVSARWSGLTNDTDAIVTDANGQAVITSNNTKSKGAFTVTVTNLSAAGYTYNSGSNVVTSASVAN